MKFMAGMTIEWSVHEDRALRSSDMSLPQQEVSFTSLYDTEHVRSADLLKYFEQLWHCAELLHACLADPFEDCRPSCTLRPAVFYLGHPITVIFQKLRKNNLLQEKAECDILFDSDVFRWLVLDDEKSVRERKATVDRFASWQPCISSIFDARRSAYLAMRETICSTKVYNYDDDMVIDTSCDCKEKGEKKKKSDLLSPVLPEWAILMSIEHVHITLESYVRFIRHLPVAAFDVTALLKLKPHWRRAPSKPLELRPKNQLVPLRGGAVSWLGLRVEPKATNDLQSIYEEEIERAKLRADARRTCRQGGGRGIVQVVPFQAAKFKVSNGEFLDFVQAGGYFEERFWSKKGWAWCQSGNITHPYWWRLYEVDNQMNYLLRDTFEEIPMPWDWPVEVSLWEAEAFLGWINADRGAICYALPTEAQHTLFNGLNITEEPEFEQAVHHGCAQGWRCPMSNLDWKYHSASPVDGLTPSASGIHDPAGNLWEWVLDDAPPSTDPDTALTTECGSHALVGGCWASSGDPATSARYNAGGPCPGRGTLLQYASFRYVLNYQQ